MTDGELPVTDAPASAAKTAFIPGGIQTFACPNCGGTVGIRAAGISISAVCQSCGSIIDVTDENYRILSKAAVRMAKSQISLGARGTLFGTEWEVIGYCILTDETKTYSWREYLLFNPYQGFRFLVESDGHWNFVKMLRKTIEGAGSTDTLELDGNNYRVYVRGGSIVAYVMGEFYWRVQVGMTSRVADYIAPPYMLSMEETLGDVIWSQAKYVRYTDIIEAFGLQDLPKPQGISPNQPNPYQGKFASIMGMAALFIVLLLTMQAISAKHSMNQVIYQRQMQIPAAYRGQLLISDPIELTGDHANVSLAAMSPVNNNWVELDVTLVNDATQETEDAIMPIEYYYGSDSDGSWSEGSTKAEVVFSAVPAGHYHLQVEADAGAFTQNEPVNLVIDMVRDKPLGSNCAFALLLLLAYPIVAAVRRWRFETKRWSTSDYAPFGHKSGDDDA